MVRIAEGFAANAGPLLMASQSMLLTLTMTIDPNGPTSTVHYWNSHGHLLPLVSTVDNALRHSLIAFEQSGRTLLGDLLQRWPVNARPPALGIVTDGSGVAFSSDHPSPMHADWLAMHMGGRRTTINLLPFSSNSYWARLIAPIRSQRIH